MFVVINILFSFLSFQSALRADLKDRYNTVDTCMLVILMRLLSFLLIIITNRIYNKVLDFDWFSMHLLVVLPVRNHMGIQFEQLQIQYL